MKTFLVTLIATAAFAASVLADGHVRNVIVAATDQPLVINIGEWRTIKIVNFIQDSAAGDRGSVSVSRENGPAVTVLGATYGRGESEIQKDLFIDGPAQLTVTPAGVALFLSYKLTAR